MCKMFAFYFCAVFCFGFSVCTQPVLQENGYSNAVFTKVFPKIEEMEISNLPMKDYIAHISSIEAGLTVVGNVSFTDGFSVRWEGAELKNIQAIIGNGATISGDLVLTGVWVLYNTEATLTDAKVSGSMLTRITSYAYKYYVTKNFTTHEITTELGFSSSTRPTVVEPIPVNDYNIVIAREIRLDMNVNAGMYESLEMWTTIFYPIFDMAAKNTPFPKICYDC